MELNDHKITTILLIGIIFAGALGLSLAIPPVTVVITSSGRIGMISALHVDGRNIKDSAGNVVVLRGVNKVEFADDPDGIWLGNTMWTDANVQAELAAMRSWGINAIRCHLAVEEWNYNLGPDANSAISHRDAIKRLLSFAAQRGIYVILDGYSIRNYYHGGDQDPLPFPPYQISANASQVIANMDDFASWWASMATELQSYSNALFDLWNEPGMSEQDWYIAAQKAITAIRGTGASNLIILEWAPGIYCNLPDNQTANWGYTLADWIPQAIGNVTDPTGNLVYSAHMYRTGGSTGLYVTQAMKDLWQSNYAWDYNEIKRAFEYMGLKWIGDTLNKPLLIGEVGANLGMQSSNPVEYQHEIVAWNNTLTLYDQWNISYLAFWWRDIGGLRLHTGAANFTPTESGTILRDHLLGAA